MSGWVHGKQSAPGQARHLLVELLDLLPQDLGLRGRVSRPETEARDVIVQRVAAR